MDNESATPKYIQLKNHLKACIKSGELKHGEKIHSENALSKSFEISRHTVRQAIGSLESEGWLYRVQGSGTFVSRFMGQQRQKSNIIGVITTYLDDYIFPGIIKGIDNVLTQEGYNIVLGHTDNKVEKEAACISNMMGKSIDGFIIETTKSAIPNPNHDFYEDMDRRGIPYIFINGYYSGHESSYVIVDDELGGYTAARHLLDLGHNKIGGIFKIDDIQGHRRYQGVLKAHRELGLSISEDSIVWFTTEDVENMFCGDGNKHFLRRLEGCTGLICYNDQIAIKVLDVFRDKGIKVPEDMSVVSFDDSELASAAEIKLTTIAHPGIRLGEKTAGSLLDLLENRKSVVKEIMKPTLIVRNSTIRLNACSEF